MGRAVFAGAILLSVGTTNAQAQYIYTTVNVPGATSTYAYGISGNDIVGEYWGGNSWHGFLYDGSTYTTLDVPGAQGTGARGISGEYISGWYGGNGPGGGFLYDSGFYIPLNVAGVTLTGAAGISVYESFEGGVYYEMYNVVGGCEDSNGGHHGFVYNGSGFTTLDMTGGSYWTVANGISGNNIVGFYTLSTSPYTDHGFLYNGSSYATVDVPGAVGDGTRALGISGSKIVGYYQDANGHHGFIYDGSSFTTFDVPGSLDTFATGINGNNIVGYYYNGSTMEGFLATPVPEPSCLVLLAIGATALVVVRRRHSRN